MKVDYNGNTIGSAVEEIEVINDDIQELTITLNTTKDTLSITDSDESVYLYSSEDLDNLIKGLQLARSLGWLQKPKVVEDNV